MDVNELYDRVAAEAKPPAVLDRLGYQDWEEETLLDDLVKSHAWLDRELKEELLADIIGLSTYGTDVLNTRNMDETYVNVPKFAAMDPVVDLDKIKASLGM